MKSWKWKYHPSRVNPYRKLYSLSNYNKNSARYYNNSSDYDILESGYTRAQGWGGLKKAWFAYNLAVMQHDEDKKQMYAGIIQRIEKDMGLPLKSFPELKMMALGYYRDNAEHMGDEINGDEIIDKMIHDDSYMEKFYDDSYYAGEKFSDNQGESFRD